MFRQVLWCSLLLFLCCMQAGIAVSANPLPPADTPYIRKYPGQLHISTGLQTNNSAVVVTDLASGQNFFLSPRLALQQFLKVEYRGMALKYALSPEYLNPDISAITGKTTRRSFGYGLGVGPLALNFSYERSKGYYLANTADFDSTWRLGDPYVQFSDLRSELYGLELSYNVRKQFSKAATNSCRERQLRPAWSFIPAITINHFTFIDDASASDSTSPNATRYLDCNAKLLLAGTLPLFRGRLQLSGMLGPIAGASFVRGWAYDASMQRYQDTRTTLMSLGFAFNTGLSFNARHWFTGLNAFVEQYGTTRSGARLGRQFYGVALYAGVRFREPKFLKSAADRAFERIEELNPLK